MATVTCVAIVILCRTTVNYYRSYQNNLNDYRRLSKVHPKAVEIVSWPVELWQDLIVFSECACSREIDISRQPVVSFHFALLLYQRLD